MSARADFVLIPIYKGETMEINVVINPSLSLEEKAHQIKSYKQELSILSKEISNEIFKDYPAQFLERFFNYSLFRDGVPKTVMSIMEYNYGQSSTLFNLFLQDLVDCTFTDKKVNFSKYAFMLDDTTNATNAERIARQPVATQALKINIPPVASETLPYHQLCNLLSKIGPAGVLSILRLLFAFQEQTVFEE